MSLAIASTSFFACSFMVVTVFLVLATDLAAVSGFFAAATAVLDDPEVPLEVADDFAGDLVAVLELATVFDGVVVFVLAGVAFAVDLLDVTFADGGGLVVTTLARGADAVSTRRAAGGADAGRVPPDGPGIM